jgi:diacylglycerol kinase (ATP)
MRVTVIHNPSAGPARYGCEDLLDTIRGAGHEIVYRSTKARGWREVLDRPAELGDVVVAAGGDGTVDKVGVAMAGRGVPIAILPLGTANNIAASLGMSADVESLVAGWEGATARPFDVGLVHGVPTRSRFLEAVGVGVFPDMMAAKKHEPRGASGCELERDVERIAGCSNVESPRYWHVSLDGRDLSGEYLAVEVMNIPAIGPALSLAPSADPGDGLLDVVVVPTGARGELTEYLARRLRGDRRGPSLPVSRGRHLVLQGSGSDVHVDGSLIRERATKTSGLTVHVGIWPHALDVLV